MWLLPIAAAGVSLIFSALIAQQWFSKKRPHQLAWALALLMFAIASFTAGVGVLGGWTPNLFRTYYLFGAIINVPFLAAGTIYLLGPRPVGHLFAALVIIGALFAAGAVFSAELDVAALDVRGIPSAREVLEPTSMPRALSRYFSYTGFIIVVAGALWSAWRLSRQQSEHLGNLAVGNVLIAAGTFVVAIAGAFARFGRGSIFAALQLVGVSLMFAGFLKTRAGPAKADRPMPQTAPQPQSPHPGETSPPDAGGSE